MFKLFLITASSRYQLEAEHELNQVSKYTTMNFLYKFTT